MKTQEQKFQAFVKRQQKKRQHIFSGILQRAENQMRELPEGSLESLSLENQRLFREAGTVLSLSCNNYCEDAPQTDEVPSSSTFELPQRLSRRQVKEWEKA